MRAVGGVAAVVGITAALALAAPAAAQSPACSGDLGSLPDPKDGAAPLTFGIYPGGLAGQIAGPPAEPKPDDPAKIVSALGELRGGPRPFVLHLYLEWNGTGDTEERVRAVESQIDRYTGAGYAVELVLTYRPRARRGEADVRDFVAFTRAMVYRLGARLKALQVMNEVNNDLSPDASDGAYPGARDALPQAIIAAAAEKRALLLDDLEIGMNWFYRRDPQYDHEFWTELGQKGGPELARSLDWVGLDAYPGTFFPPAGSRYRESMVNAMSALRECYMPLAGLGENVPIHVVENGYPTGPGRSFAEQERALRDMVRAVHDFRGNYNVTDYRWFDLRDGDSSNPNFGQQYGLMLDDYTPKPAFGAYRDLVGELGCIDQRPPSTRITGASTYLSLLNLVGTTNDDPACATGAARVDVAVARPAGRGRCRFIVGDRPRHLSRPRSCRRPILLRATGVKTWSLAVTRIPRGRYRVTARARDAVGNKEPPRARTSVGVRTRR
jgi:hypothetical protein